MARRDRSTFLGGEQSSLCITGAMKTLNTELIQIVMRAINDTRKALQRIECQETTTEKGISKETARYKLAARDLRHGPTVQRVR